MKKINLLLLAIFSFAFSMSGYAQKAKIETNEKSIITIISAVGNDEIFTENGSLKFLDIKEVLFEVYDAKYLTTYNKIKIKVPVKFGDGTDLGEVSKDEIPKPIVIKDLSNYADSYPEDYLIKGSNRALTGIGLSALGSVIAILGSSSSDLGEEASIAGGVLALVGVVFVVDGWSKIGKAGKSMKAERAKKDKEKN